MSKAKIENKIRSEEQKDMKKSAGITTGIILMMTLLAIFWTAVRGTIPPPGQKQYEVSGAIDFGTDRKGRRDINTLEDPSPTPSENINDVTEPTPVEQNHTNQQQQTTEHIIQTDENPDLSTTQTNQNNDVPDPNPVQTNNENTNNDIPDPNPNQNQNQNTTNTNNNTTGGSDHGSTNESGNQGTQQTQVLDPNGMYTFGDGGNGLNGRMPIDLKDPVYNVQQEAKLTFEFIIAPSGKVKYVKPPVTNKTELKKRGMEAIRKWTFNPVDEWEGDQKTKVTITFRLK